MAELIIQSGKLQGRRVILPDREVSVGRDEDCLMRIASSLVSRKHCTLRATPEGIWVRDLESQNGTYVNDVAITEPFLLKAGDVLRIGASLFQVPRVKPSSSQLPGDGSGTTGTASKADITHLLSDDEHTMKSGVPETEIIKGRKNTTSTPDMPAAPSSASELTSTSPTANRPQTIKEQAAEIIRRHWETVRAKK
jgi:pSer/pThr/pTyr-binding forkhead associated (FHA) protein